MVWNISPVNGYEAQSAIIPFVGIIIRNEYELRQQRHLIFIIRRVVTKKANFNRRQNVLVIVRSQYQY
jgi:hypothetical protein